MYADNTVQHLLRRRPWKNWADAEHPFHDDDPTDAEQQQASDAWFQWFEMTPHEVGCDELEAWVPTWAFGRRFEAGRSTTNLPEQSLALLLGLCTSAPAGPLSSYLATIQRALPVGFIGDSINNMASGVKKMWGKKDTAIFENHHPLHASNEHNFLYHYTQVKPGEARPPGIENSPRIHLIDSGLVRSVSWLLRRWLAADKIPRTTIARRYGPQHNVVTRAYL